jgi:magnesium-transporting ATPase (P-type)
MAYNRKSLPHHRYHENDEESKSSVPIWHSEPASTSNDNSILAVGTLQHHQSRRMTTTISVISQIWDDINAANGNSTAVEEGDDSLRKHLESGWTTDQASQRREKDGCFNVVKPPIDCPNWLCILLPCINHLASMKAFRSIQPDDAEVLRNGKWIRYDAASLVTGDIIRLDEGDLIPADCVVIDLEDNDKDLLVDLAVVTGQDRPKAINGATAATRHQRQLYLGGRVVQGQATAMVTSSGPQTLLATLIRENRFPPKEPILEAFMDGSGDAGIQLGQMS